MIIDFVAVLDQGGLVRSVKGKNGVTVDRGQIAIRIEIDLDDDIFESPPLPVVRIKPTRAQLIRSHEIGVENG